MQKTGESEKELEHYKAALRRQEQAWQARFQMVLHSDRAAVDVGLTTLRTAILVNAGAIVALLAFVGQLWSRDTDTMVAVLRGATWFVFGLIVAGVAACIAYFYQSFVTAAQQRRLAEVSKAAEDLKPWSIWPWLTRVTAVVMVGLVVASYMLFILGAFELISTLAP